MRLAAVGDLHCTRSSAGAYRQLFRRISDDADVAVLCGDLTDYGLPEEAELLAHELQAGLSIPAVAVLGNHDHESGRPEKVRHILQHAGVMMLNGDACKVKDVGFAGVKGFGGGFGRHACEAWGEEPLKRFVQATVEEANLLDKALARLACDVKVVLMHYSPIVATVQGEPPEIFALLGSSRLETAMVRHRIAVVFHGHSHSGSPAGQLVTGTPVYNVAMPLLRRLGQPHGPYRLFDVGGDAHAAAPVREGGEPESAVL